MTRIVFTGGGTAGHITPNIALIQKLKEKHPHIEILYVGSSRGPEAKMIPEIGVKFKGVQAGKLRRYFSWKNILDFFRIPIGFAQSFLTLFGFKPAVVFSKGGYVGIPIVLAAKALRIPIVLHESDVLPGLANKMASDLADVICMSYVETKDLITRKVKKVVTGNPVREFILKGNRDRGFEYSGLSQNHPVVLIMGGSQGAQHINEALIKALPKINANVIHITGKGKKIADNTDQYKSFEYVNKELPDLYAISDVIVSRSGANSLAEIDALGIPAILIPIAKAASRGEQTINAEAHKKLNPETIIIKDEALSSENLAKSIEKLLRSPKKEKHQNNAVDKILEVLEEYVGRN
ncbi:undecaprenyldiphospho-muramoylpentapeptide beta-N-acetylglucosaminyltransferase [Patescibacteria group bacterium]